RLLVLLYRGCGGMYSKKMVQLNKVLYNILLTLVILLSCMIVTVLVSPWFNNEFANRPDKELLSEEYDEVVESFSWQLKVIVAPFPEEMLFRFPLLMIVLKYGKAHKNVMYLLALVFGIAFSLIHISNANLYSFYSVLFTLSVHGFLYGVLVIKTRSIVCPMVAHGAYNGIVLL
ncbi:MAG: CPBP family intramembrane metalloprotease, partial [Methanophagales archaeon]|nr:CPBP family intramembrane metalloprotease [Methanophagales archaeon]